MDSWVKNGKVSGVVYRVQGCLGHLMYRVNLHSNREFFCTHARSKASESVSISISYFSIYLSNSSVPSTLSIFNNWSTLSDPRKKCSLRNICVLGQPLWERKRRRLYAPARQAYSPRSTCPGCSHSVCSQPKALGLCSTGYRPGCDIPWQDDKTPPSPSQSDAAVLRRLSTVMFKNGIGQTFRVATSIMTFPGLTSRWMIPRE